MENFQSIISLSEFFLLAVGNTACKQLVYITWFIFIKFRWGILIYSIEIWKRTVVYSLCWCICLHTRVTTAPAGKTVQTTWKLTARGLSCHLQCPNKQCTLVTLALLSMPASPEALLTDSRLFAITRRPLSVLSRLLFTAQAHTRQQAQTTHIWRLKPTESMLEYYRKLLKSRK